MLWFFQKTESYWTVRQKMRNPIIRLLQFEQILAAQISMWCKRIKELKKLRQWLAYSSLAYKSSWILITSLDQLDSDNFPGPLGNKFWTKSINTWFCPKINLYQIIFSACLLAHSAVCSDMYKKIFSITIDSYLSIPFHQYWLMEYLMLQ